MIHQKTGWYDDNDHLGSGLCGHCTHRLIVYNSHSTIVDSHLLMHNIAVVLHLTTFPSNPLHSHQCLIALLVSNKGQPIITLLQPQRVRGVVILTQVTNQ